MTMTDLMMDGYDDEGLKLEIMPLM